MLCVVRLGYWATLSAAHAPYVLPEVWRARVRGETMGY